MTDISSYTPITFRRDLSKYLISRKGEIYSLYTHQVLKPQIDRVGYYYCTVKNDSGKNTKIMLHIAVAKQYIPNPDPEHKTLVNHIDENKRNSSVDNLEWVTPKENANHGTRNARISRNNHKPINEYDLDGRYIRTWAGCRAIVRFFGEYFGKTLEEMQSCENSINGCCRGKSKSSMNRIWRPYEGNAKDIKVKKGYMPIGIACSRSKMRFDLDVDVPAEYLYHKPTKAEIVEYFMNHDRLTGYEKDMIKQLL